MTAGSLTTFESFLLARMDAQEALLRQIVDAIGTVEAGESRLGEVMAYAKRLEGELARLKAGVRPEDIALAAAIREVFGARDFLAKSLVKAATGVPGLSRALDAALGSRSANVRAVGNHLGKIADCPLDGLTIRQLGKERNATVWVIREFRGAQTNAN